MYTRDITLRRLNMKVGWNFRVDEELNIEAREYCQRNGHTLTWLVHQAVREYIDQGNQLAALEKKIASIKP